MNENNENIECVGNIDGVEGVEGVGNVEGVEGVESVESVEDVGSVEGVEGVESVKNNDLHLGEGSRIIDGKLHRTVDYSKTEQTHLLMSAHMNGAGRLFGGQLLAWLDEMAGIVAMRHAGCNVITACIDNLEFKNGCYLNDLVVLVGYITHVGRSSMEVRIDTYVEKPDGSRHPVNRAFFVMVALDENQNPVEVPRLLVDSVAQQAKWEAAERRIQLRKHRKLEGY